MHRVIATLASSPVVDVEPGKATTFSINGTNVTINYPASGVGTRGVVIADPCFEGGAVGCPFARTFQTFERSTALINAALAGEDVDYWMILG